METIRRNARRKTCRVQALSPRRFRLAAAATVLLLLLPGLIHGEAHRDAKLQALSPSFWKLIGQGTPVTLVASGFGFTEGPVWDRSGYLWVSDETLNKIFKLYPDGHRDEMIALGDPDGSTYDRAHRLI